MKKYTNYQKKNKLQNNSNSLQTTIQKLINILKNKTDNDENNIENLKLDEIAKLIVALNKINSEIEANTLQAEPQSELILKIYSSKEATKKLMELIEIID